MSSNHHDHSWIEAYIDDDWTSNVTDPWITLGYCIFVRGNLVTWRSKKQNVVARSSVEVEFRVVAHRICKLLWLKKLLEELKVTSLMPMKHYGDNKAVINMAHNSIQHDKTKHVKVD